MRVFGTKQVDPSYEDQAAVVRLQALAARFKPAPRDDDFAITASAEEQREEVAD